VERLQQHAAEGRDTDPARQENGRLRVLTKSERPEWSRDGNLGAECQGIQNALEGRIAHSRRDDEIRFKWSAGDGEGPGIPFGVRLLRVDERYVNELSGLEFQVGRLLEMKRDRALGDRFLLLQSDSVVRHWAPLELERLQVFDQILLLLLGQFQPPKAVVVVNNLTEVRKTAIVVVAGLRVAPESGEGRGAVHVGR